MNERIPLALIGALGCARALEKKPVVKLQLQAKWDGAEAIVSGKGATGKLMVSENRILVDIKLGFALNMLKGAINNGVEATIDEVLATRLGQRSHSCY